MMAIVDRTVAFSINVAATVALTDYDRDLALLNAKEVAVAMMGGRVGGEPKYETEWETIDILD